MSGGKFGLSGLSKSAFSTLSSNRPFESFPSSIGHSPNTVSVLISRLTAKDVKSDK
jgi:hypothetical protein